MQENNSTNELDYESDEVLNIAEDVASKILSTLVNAFKCKVSFSFS